MSKLILDSHDAIGWDFDQTLYGHRFSPRMHRFILAHPEKRHVIVTFRSHGMQHDVWDLLANDYPHAPMEDDFDGVLNIPDEMFERFAWRDQRRRMRKLAGMDADPLHQDELDYIEWKGLICRQAGLTLLVDDNAPHTETGCRKHNIAYVNPDDLYDL